MSVPIPWDSLREIVVFRTDHIGDLIVSTPFLRALRQAAPQARLSAVIPRAARGVVEGNSDLDQLFDREDWDQQVRPDLAIALSPRTATYKLVYATRARFRAGYFYPERLLTRISCRVWLTHAKPMLVRKQLGSGQPVPHEIEQHAQFAEFLGFPVRDKSPTLPIGATDLQWGREEANGRLAVHLSVNWFSQGWTTADFIEMCSQIADPLIITYGPAEAEIAAALRQSPGWSHPLYGDLSLKRWGALLAGSWALISTDTGAVHVAAAHGRPVVVVYKPEQYDLCSQQWHPWGVPFRALTKHSPAATALQIREALEQLSPPS